MYKCGACGALFEELEYIDLDANEDGDLAVTIPRSPCCSSDWTKGTFVPD